MNEEEKVFVQQFVADDRMVEAVRKALLDSLSLDKAVEELDFLIGDNNLIGQKTRARVTAMEMLRESFKLLSKFKKTEQKVGSSFNEAR